MGREVGLSVAFVCSSARYRSLSLKLPSPALCNAVTSDQLQSRLTERHIVRTSVTYPALQLPPPGSLFFWPVCVQAIWFICGACCLVPYCVWLAADNNFVYVIALYFSKAFNTVRHVTLMDKMAAVLALPGDFFSSHSHCAKFADEVGYLLLYRHHGQCYTRFQSWSRIIHLLIPLTCAAQVSGINKCMICALGMLPITSSGLPMILTSSFEFSSYTRWWGHTC